MKKIIVSKRNKVLSGVDWDYFDKFEPINDKYLPASGEGETVAEQIVTAINKLVYKWYNDGDVYDNNYHMEGWANDLSSYANWLYNNVGGLDSLEDIYEARSDEDYETILMQIANYCLNEEFLSRYTDKPKMGSIYNCDGPFSFRESSDDECPNCGEESAYCICDNFDSDYDDDYDDDIDASRKVKASYEDDEKEYEDECEYCGSAGCEYCCPEDYQRGLEEEYEGPSAAELGYGIHDIESQLQEELYLSSTPYRKLSDKDFDAVCEMILPLLNDYPSVIEAVDAWMRANAGNYPDIFVKSSRKVKAGKYISQEGYTHNPVGIRPDGYYGDLEYEPDDDDPFDYGDSDYDDESEMYGCNNINCAYWCDNCGAAYDDAGEAMTCQCDDDEDLREASRSDMYRRKSFSEMNNDWAKQEYKRRTGKELGVNSACGLCKDSGYNPNCECQVSDLEIEFEESDWDSFEAFQIAKELKYQLEERNLRLGIDEFGEDVELTPNSGIIELIMADPLYTEGNVEMAVDNWINETLTNQGNFLIGAFEDKDVLR